MTVAWLRNAGTDEDECWVPCAKGDPGATQFSGVAQAARESPQPEQMRSSGYAEQSDSGTWTAGIDVMRSYPYQDTQWHLHAIEFHHKVREEVEWLRDRWLAANSPSVSSTPSKTATPEPIHWPTKGDMMTFLGKNGYDQELKEALRIFKVGQQYRVLECNVHSFSHSVRFEDVVGWYNGVMFERTTELPSTDQVCPGGIDPGFGECPKCGATMDDDCGSEA